MYRLLTLLNTPRYSGTLVLMSAFRAFSNLSHPSVWQLSLFTAKRHGWVNVSDFFFYQLMSRLLKCFSIALTHFLARSVYARQMSKMKHIISKLFDGHENDLGFQDYSTSLFPGLHQQHPGVLTLRPTLLGLSTENMEIAIWHVLSYFVTDTLFLTNGQDYQKRRGSYSLVIVIQNP